MSQSIHYLDLQRRRLLRTKTECLRDGMRVFISDLERAMADRAIETVENRGEVAATQFFDNSREIVRESSREENGSARTLTVLIPVSMHRLVDNRLGAQSNDNRRLGSQQMPVRLPVVLLTPLVIPTRNPDHADQAPQVDLPPRAASPPRIPPRRRHADVPHRVTYRQALRVQNCENVATFRLGSPENPSLMTEKCRFCVAEFFTKESRSRNGDRYVCCGFGKVNIPLLKECPLELRELYTLDGHRNVNFRNNIRSANSMFAMASFKANIPVDRNVGQGHWCFHITGQIYHYVNPIPNSDYRNNFSQNNISYNQYYFIDAQDAINRRSAFFGGLFDDETVTTLERMLRRENPLVVQYMSMAEVIRRRRQEDRRRGDGAFEAGPSEIFLAFRDSLAGRVRINGLSTEHTEVAAIFVGEEPPRDVDLVIYERGRGDTRAHELRNLNPLADPMVYPLLFPKGEQGYRMKMRLINQPRTLVQRSGRLEPVIIDNYDGPRPNQNADVLPPDDAAGVPVPRRRPTRQHITMRQFYRYRLQHRRPITDNTHSTHNVDELFMPPEFSTLHNGGKLFQQYLVDAWVRVESDQLWYIKQNQRTLRKTNYSALQTYLEQRARHEHAQIGKIVVLPKSFIGGKRNSNRRYLDAMTTVARHGKPDIFITFTCNPNWPEIKNNLEYKQKFQHRPDLVCRVFYAKFMELMDDLYRKQFFGVALNFMYSVEFQLRGLPHVHILLTLRPEDRLIHEQDVDAAVQGAFPDHREEPRLFGLVARHMVHGPCGAHNPAIPCMKDGRCSKHFPKAFRERTNLVGDADRLNQPEYRRPQDGRGFDLGGFFIDNSWVVPFNKHLLAKYDCHVNVELCGSIKSIKYLHKYVNKGPDFCQIRHAQVEQPHDAARGQPTINWDEVQQYQDYRYVSAPEAVWRLMEFPMHDRSHAVLVLPVHLPDQREVIFDEEDEVEDIRLIAERPTKLEAWFALNANCPDARTFRYQDVPEHFTWNNNTSAWQQRRQTSKTLGCIVEVSPADGERFYLRMLLENVRGATSFVDLRTVNGVVHDTFLNTCRARNLLLNIDEYERCLRDGVQTRSPFRLRVLFALIACLMHNSDADPELITGLWHIFKNDLILDFLERGDNPERAELNAIFHIKTVINRSALRGELAHMTQIGLPDVDLNDLTFRDVAVDIDELLDRNLDDDVVHGGRGSGRPVRYSRIDTLNESQLAVFDVIMSAIDRYINHGPVHGGNLFFLDGPGGTGKTYLYNVLLDEVRTRFGRPCLAVAWTGIAATLLRGGKTVHSTFRLPLNLDDRTVAGYPLESDKAQIIRDAVIILWDEAPMTPRKAVEAIDRYLRNLMSCPGLPMGGKIVLFGGDFRQLLPVMTRAHSGQVIDASLKRWPLWRSVIIHHLTSNLRASRAADGNPDDNLNYAARLLRIGDGVEPTRLIPGRTSLRNLIELPPECTVSDRDALIDYVYGVAPVDTEVAGLAIADKAILCPTNRAVDEVNSHVLERLAGEPKTYFSVDQYMGDDAENGGLHIPQDLLHSVKISSLGPHELTLKVGAVVMLIRNLDLSSGLCNGTRLRVLSMREHMLELQVLTGGIDDHRGKVVYLPKMHLTASPSSGTNVPGTMRRFQFPIRLAFAMTINKSQGQTFRKVGIYLDTPCFTHGQLYVSMSRVGCLSALRVFVKNLATQGCFFYRDGRRFTLNVVFPEIVQDAVPSDPVRGESVGTRSRVRPDELPRIRLVDDEGVDGTNADSRVDIAGGLSQFYVDDWSEEFVDAIDRQLADADHEIDVVDVAIDHTERPVETGFITAGTRMPDSVSSLEEVDDDLNYSDQPLPFIPPAPDLPHPELPARVSVGTRAGTSGLGGLVGRSNWWHRPPQTDTDTDSE